MCWRKGRHILSSGVCLHDQCADGLDITVIKIPDRKEYLFIWTHSSIAGSYGGRCIIQRSLKKQTNKKQTLLQLLMSMSVPAFRLTSYIKASTDSKSSFNLHQNSHPN